MIKKHLSVCYLLYKISRVCHKIWYPTNIWPYPETPACIGITQLALLVTFLHAPFLFLLHQSGILYLHMFALSTISVRLSVVLNHTFSSQLSLPSHSVPVPPIRSSRFWRSINLVVCMYVWCIYHANKTYQTLNTRKTNMYEKPEK